jgi:hypothetical protein
MMSSGCPGWWSRISTVHALDGRKCGVDGRGPCEAVPTGLPVLGGAVKVVSNKTRARNNWLTPIKQKCVSCTAPGDTEAQLPLIPATTMARSGGRCFAKRRVFLAGGGCCGPVVLCSCAPTSGIRPPRRPSASRTRRPDTQIPRRDRDRKTDRSRRQVLTTPRSTLVDNRCGGRTLTSGTPKSPVHQPRDRRP